MTAAGASAGAPARAAVLGAGTMGAQIAAHIANAGVPVLLLDRVPDGAPANDADARSTLANAALKALARADPPAFMHRRGPRLVETGNLDDDLDRLADCDWVVEAVVEDPAVKAALFGRLAEVLAPHAVLTSNTSTLPRALLARSLPPALAQRFAITHFFNPPRYMRLVELVADGAAADGPIAALADFLDRGLGKTVVHAKDSPGFIANRIGAFWMQTAINEAFDRSIGVADADAVLSRPFGIPKTGVFALIDLIGLDIIPNVVAALSATLPRDDPFQRIVRQHGLIARLIAEGATGRKGGGGFYRLNRAGGARVKEAIDLETGRYAPAGRPRLAEIAGGDDPAALLAGDAPAARYAAAVMTATLAYAATVAPAIADDVAAVDAAMTTGYNWRNGPFRLIDRIGAGRLAERLAADGAEVPPLLARAAAAGGFYGLGDDGRPQGLTATGVAAPLPRRAGTLALDDVRRAGPPLFRNASAALWDIGDGVTLVEFTTKMNTLDAGTFACLRQAVARTAEGFRALVIGGEAENFSVGANLGFGLFAANLAAWDRLDAAIREGQETLAALSDAPFPVVGAPSGLALGGGLEVLMHCDHVQAHGETYAGLVEVGVGIIPAWGGATRLLLRHLARPGRPGGPMPAIIEAFRTIALAQVAKSAAEARDYLYLRREDGITMNRDRLLADAKACALARADGYRPPAPPAPVSLPGRTGAAALKLQVDGFAKLGQATPHDVTVAGELAGVLTGGDCDWTAPVDAQHLLDLERAAFGRLVRTEATLARMEHMLATGKPLRN